MGFDIYQVEIDKYGLEYSFESDAIWIWVAGVSEVYDDWHQIAIF